jgi:glyoxylase-like metal-dependent hydrolase (beta-lactamase superfamily II)
MENKMHQGADNHIIPMTSVSAGEDHEVRRNIFYYTNQIVNIVFVGAGESGGWVLIDAGMPGSSSKIIEEAAHLFPLKSKPEAIILTHGHFDHVGGIVALIEKWQVPVYAHPLEFPYLTGMKDYPEPDATVEGGLLAKLAFIYPHKATNIKEGLLPLPENGSVPALPGWRWIHTPGHSPGHVSFFRDSDKTLIAGDAFITVRQDSMYKVLIQSKEVNGPPRYFTTDWEAAFDSVKKLQELQPEVVVTGHGKAMEGNELREGLKNLVENFNELAVPDHGKYV